MSDSDKIITSWGGLVFFLCFGIYFMSYVLKNFKTHRKMEKSIRGFIAALISLGIGIGGIILKLLDKL
jgi:GTP cyclohydrolase III